MQNTTPPSSSFFGYISSLAQKGLELYERTFLPSGIKLQKEIDDARAELEAKNATNRKIQK